MSSPPMLARQVLDACWRGGKPVCASLALLASVVAGPIAVSPRPAEAATEARGADEFLIVDCLLPGRVRRLGTRVTYVTPRRPVKTTTSDCAIRGGEYTAHDRASYATALKIWLPLAREGDPVAQTHVGEIYEKGLGVPPEHKLAARWYQKAAEQDYARAQVNLGALFEQGLGVPKDTAQAVKWYRRASGLEEMGVPFVPGEVQAELDRLRTERSQLVEERDAMGRQLEQVRRQLEDAQRRLRERRGEAESAQRRLEAARVDLERRKQAAAAAGNQAEVAKLERELETKSAEAERRQAQVSRLREQVASLEREAQGLKTALGATIAGSTAEIERYKSEAEAAKSELSRVTTRLAEAEQGLKRARSATTAKEADVEKLRAQLRRERKSAELDESQLKALEEKLKARETDLEGQRQQLAQLKSSVVALENDTRRLRTAEKSAASPGPARQSAQADLRIVIIDPPLPVTRASGPTTVRTRAQGTRLIVGRVEAPNGLLALMVNDQEQKPGDDGLFRVSVPIQLPTTPIKVVAIDAKGRRASLEFVLAPMQTDVATRTPREEPTPSAPILPDIDFGNYHALVIGNNNYKLLPKLETAATDAKSVGQLLETKYGFKVTVIINANRYQILSTLNTLREELTEEDNLLIYYAGHGELDRINNRGHWLPVDAEPDSSANWISNIQITDVLNAMSVRKVMVVADSCYSGTLTRAALARLDAGMSDTMRANWLTVMAKKRSRIALTSGGVQPVLDSSGGQHSVFAGAFLEVLRANVQVLDGQRVFQGVSERVAAMAATVNVEQVPQYAPIKYAGHEAGDFLFVPAAN